MNSMCLEEVVALTVVQIEADSDHALYVEELLTEHGHRVIRAENGFTGMRLASRTRPNLVLIDLDLPDFDSRIIVSLLRNLTHYKRLPIIATSRYDSDQMHGLAIMFGFNGFIAKPVNAETFAAQIEQYATRPASTSFDPEAKAE